MIRHYRGHSRCRHGERVGSVINGWTMGLLTLESCDIGAYKDRAWCSTLVGRAGSGVKGVCVAVHAVGSVQGTKREWCVLVNRRRRSRVELGA